MLEFRWSIIITSHFDEAWTTRRTRIIWKHLILFYKERSTVGSWFVLAFLTPYFRRNFFNRTFGCEKHYFLAMNKDVCRQRCLLARHGSDSFCFVANNKWNDNTFLHKSFRNNSIVFTSCFFRGMTKIINIFSLCFIIFCTKS
jgi:hypothetical protein